MGNLENAKDLGQSIYTKAEVNVEFDPTTTRTV